MSLKSLLGPNGSAVALMSFRVYQTKRCRHEDNHRFDCRTVYLCKSVGSVVLHNHLYYKTTFLELSHFYLKGLAMAYWLPN